MTAPRPEAVDDIVAAAQATLVCMGASEKLQREFCTNLRARIDAALTAAENKGRSVHGLCCSECGGHMGIGYCLPCVGKKEAAARADERERAARKCEEYANEVLIVSSLMDPRRVVALACAAAIRAMEG